MSSNRTIRNRRPGGNLTIDTDGGQVSIPDAQRATSTQAGVVGGQLSDYATLTAHPSVPNGQARIGETLAASSNVHVLTANPGSYVSDTSQYTNYLQLDAGLWMVKAHMSLQVSTLDTQIVITDSFTAGTDSNLFRLSSITDAEKLGLVKTFQPGTYKARNGYVALNAQIDCFMQCDGTNIIMRTDVGTIISSDGGLPRFRGEFIASHTSTNLPTVRMAIQAFRIG